MEGESEELHPIVFVIRKKGRILILHVKVRGLVDLILFGGQDEGEEKRENRPIFLFLRPEETEQKE